jgi:hypothetical protein
LQEQGVSRSKEVYNYCIFRRAESSRPRGAGSFQNEKSREFLDQGIFNYITSCRKAYRCCSYVTVLRKTEMSLHGAFLT